MKEFAIVIPTLNNVPALSSCISAIVDTCKELDYEIVVGCDDCKESTASYLTEVAKTVPLKWVGLTGNNGFAKVCNAGAKFADAKYLIFLNDDTLPAVNWLTHMRSGFENFNKLTLLDGQPGAVGPLSNFVAGIQQLKCDKQLTPDNRHEVASQLPKKIGFSHFISGFCFFIPTDLFNEMGMWDERFFNGAEDNGLSIKLIEAGYHLAVVGDAYVYHYGSSTLKRPEYQYLKGGVKNVPDFYRWYHPTQKTKLGVAYRVKIQNDYVKDVFIRSLEKSATFADRIFIVDDNSPIAYMDDLSPETKTKIEHRHYKRTFEERRDRNELIDMCRSSGMEWMLCLDADEILEDKVDRACVERLMNPPVPHIFAYKFHEYTFWNDEQHYRVDAHWAQMAGIRMWRIQPNRHIRGGAKSTLHCEHVPVQPPACVGNTSIRIKHYGYVHAPERNRKYMWYENIDTDKQKWLIGNDNYSHIIDESDLKLRPWVEDNTLAVATMCKNELYNVCDWLHHLWSFVDKIVVCDTGSTDGTIEFLQQAGVEIVHHPWDDHYDKPRNMALDTLGTTTTWVFQVDFDERIPDLSQVRRAIDYPVAKGYMFYVRNLLKDGRITISETIRLFRTKNNWRYKSRVHETVDADAKTSGLRIFRSPVDILHSGFLNDEDKLKTKMLKYVKLSELAMDDDSTDPKPYYSLALHYMEEVEFEVIAAQYLERSFTLDPTFYQPKKELALLKIRQACRLLKDIQETIAPEHVDQASIKAILSAVHPWSETSTPIPSHIKDYFKAQLRGPRELPPLRVGGDQSKDGANSATPVGTVKD